ncbi:MAG: LysR substrate-binding domain-containing protein [Acidimicrobiales bacterium]
MSSTELVRLLGEHQVDVIFTTASDEGSQDLASILLTRLPLVLICSADHVLVGKAAVDMRALSETPLVGFPPGWGVRTLSDLAFRARGVEPHYDFEVNDTATLLDLVAVGLGVAVLPEALAAQRGARLRQIAIRCRRWDWVITAQSLPPGPPNPAAHALWTMLAGQEPTPTSPERRSEP